MSYSDEVFTRVEVISPSGRVLVCRPCRANASIQDDGHTLKVFISREPDYLPQPAAPEPKEPQP